MVITNYSPPPRDTANVAAPRAGVGRQVNDVATTNSAYRLVCKMTREILHPACTGSRVIVDESDYVCLSLCDSSLHRREDARSADKHSSHAGQPRLRDRSARYLVVIAHYDDNLRRGWLL